MHVSRDKILGISWLVIAGLLFTAAFFAVAIIVRSESAKSKRECPYVNAVDFTPWVGKTVKSIEAVDNGDGVMFIFEDGASIHLKPNKYTMNLVRADSRE